MAEEENSFELIESSDAIELVPQRELPVWWFALALFMVLLVSGLIFFFKKSTTPIDTEARERKAYIEAKEALGALGTIGVRETAVAVSCILRKYLADSKDEPALYETHEEFVSRHDVLKGFSDEIRAETGQFFSQLAEVKYAEEISGGCDSGKMAEGGMKLLERMHAV
jgi:hypothetical protein